MTDGPLASHLAAWRSAEPQFDVAWLFLRPDERVTFGALAALQHDWLHAAHDVREPQVAAARLGWWREEMQRAMAGAGQHPLAIALAADPRGRAIPPQCWQVALDGVALSLVAPPATDHAAQWQAARALAGAFAELEQRLWFGSPGASARAVDLVAGRLAVAGLRALPAIAAGGRSALPMNLLARHGLALDMLGTDSAARRAAVRDQAAGILRHLAGAVTMPGSTTLLQAVAARHDLGALRRALRADDPLAALVQAPRGLGSLLKTWRAARNWRKCASQRTIE